MAAGAPAVIERVVGLLIPPASREEVLGDLREISGNTAVFLAAAFVVVPFVVFSRIRRTSDPVVRLMEAMTLYTAFVVSARWIDAGILLSPSGFLRLAIPPAIVLAILMLADAYADPRKKSPLRPALGPVVGMIFASGAQRSMGDWALADVLMLYAGMTGVLLLTALRFAIPPIPDRPQLARIPAYWQKLELDLGILRPLIVVAIVVLIVLSRLLK